MLFVSVTVSGKYMLFVSVTVSAKYMLFVSVTLSAKYVYKQTIIIIFSAYLLRYSFTHVHTTT